MFFKFFQREEQIIFKMAKKCLQRLLKKEVNQQEALPNLIIKECVRPSLNIISQRNSNPALYEQLTRLISVLHACFNEQLGRHLIKCYESNKPRFQDDFKLHMTVGVRQPAANAGEQPQGEQVFVPLVPDQMSLEERQRYFQEDLDSLVVYQNQRVIDIENSYHITKILYLLLPQNRNEIQKILLSIPDFEIQILTDLERKFEIAYKSLFKFYKIPAYYPNIESHMRPLSIRVGQLKSSLREGMVKFYNKNAYEAIEMLNPSGRNYQQVVSRQYAGATLVDVFVDILKDPSSYCLRERLAREPENIKQYLLYSHESREFLYGIKLVEILQHFNPSIMTVAHMLPVLYCIRPRWQQISDVRLRELMSNPNAVMIRKSYNKVMHVLLDYCKNPKAKINAIIDLAKGYRNHSSIDMTPIRLFFQFEIPYKFPVERCKEILSNILERFKHIPVGQPIPVHQHNAMNHFEQNYQLFDMIFMPIITRYTDNDTLFHTLFDEKILVEFMDAIFNFSRPNFIRIDEYKQALEISPFYSNEQALAEVCKVLNLVFRYFDLNTILHACPNQDIYRVNSFLYRCSKKSKSPLLIEWALYSQTSLFIRILNSIISPDMIPQMVELTKLIEEQSEQLLQLILQHSQNATFKALLQKSFRNIIQIIESINQMKQNPTQSKGYESVALSLKDAIANEGKSNSSLSYYSSYILANYDSMYLFDSKFRFISRIARIISKFGAQHSLSIQNKQLVVELSQVMITWASIRKQQYLRASNPTKDQLKDVLSQYCYHAKNILFYLCRTAILTQSSQNESMKDILDLTGHALKQIRQLVIIFENVQPQFPLFQNLIQPQGVQAGVMESETLQLHKIISLNIFYIFAKYSETQKLEIIRFFVSVLIPANARIPKGILFSCRMLKDIFYTINLGDANGDPREQIMNDLRQVLTEDVLKCLDKNHQDVLATIKQIEDRFNAERKPPVLSFQEQAMVISSTIPHFTIRLIDYLERELLTLPQPQRALRANILKFADNDFTFYRNLAQILLKVVAMYRRQLIMDQMEVAPQKLRIKHSIPHMANNASTQYTPSTSELIPMTADDVIDIKVDDTNFDMFNKESVLIGLVLVAKKLKKMPNEEAIYIQESVSSSIQYLSKYNNNEYIIEGVRKVVDVIIEDEPDDVTRKLPEKKADLIKMMLTKIGDLQSIMSAERKENPQTILLIEKIFEQGVRFLEMQTSLMHEYAIRIFEKLFIHSKGRSIPLKRRLFDVFERFNGPSVFKKLQFFFSKHIIEDNDKLDKLSFYQAQSQFLDFMLHSVRGNVSLKKLKHTSKLFHFYNMDLQFENLLHVSESGEDAKMSEDQGEYSQIVKSVKGFCDQYEKFKDRKLFKYMDCLSEIISMNPNYSQEKMISDKLFTFLFHQYWSKLLTREEQQFLAESINKYFLQSVTIASQLQITGGITSGFDLKRYSFPRIFLEALASTSPQVRLEPEMLQLMGKTFNLWHVALPIIENHITLFPENERYYFAMNELYEKLAEGDYIAGLRRMITQSPETRSMVTYAQHDMWEEINQQFSQFIIYYAEQEGQYRFMDDEQNKPGKYMRQLPEYFMQHIKSEHVKQTEAKYDAIKQSNPDFQQDRDAFIKEEIDRLQKEIDEASGQAKFDADPATYKYPRRGPNNKVQEIDLRVWDTLFLESLKVLGKWDQYYDITRALSQNVDIPNVEMMIEYFWNTKQWSQLAQYETILKKSDQIKHRLYLIFLSIKSQNTQTFDEVFKQVTTLAGNKWDQQLPKYIDNVHYENLVLYQLIMEGSEGGRNMIKEAQSNRVRGRLVDLKTAVNIWRERLPHTSESFTVWKEVLENRNFIQDQISMIMNPSPQPPIQGPNVSDQQFQQQMRHYQENTLKQRQIFSNEFLDKCWNLYKLSQMSRKQGLPSVSLTYLTQLSQSLAPTYDSEGTKYERYKFDYEFIKLNLEYNTNPKSLARFMNEYCVLIDQRYLNPPQQPPQPKFEAYQQADLCRLIGDYFHREGQLDKSQKFLKDSLRLHKKEAKTWLSFARLNQTVFNYRKDEVSLQQILKSYFSAIALSLHKSRFIIPHILTLVKRRRDVSNDAFNQAISQALRKNLDQLPTWVWIFWLPQILQIFATQSGCQLEHFLSRVVLDKLSRYYPQAIYYHLKMRLDLLRSLLNQPTANAEERNNNQSQLSQIIAYMNNVKRLAFNPIAFLDRFSVEFVKCTKQTPEEELYMVLSKILCMSSFFKMNQFEKEFSQFLNQLHQRFFNAQNIQISPLLTELQASFERDFLNANTRENDIIQILRRLKNLKDFLHLKISLSDTQRTFLELVSPMLANFNDKGIELPGQYMVSEVEPVPQNTIYIQKFDPQIYKGAGGSSTSSVGGSSGGTSGGLSSAKRISIRCSNQRQYTFAVGHIISLKDEYIKYCQEERLSQIKLLMNQIFRRHKETMKRGIKFYVPIKALLHRAKITQDDLQFQSLQEIHDYLLQERGVDPDQALNIQIKKVDEILKDMGSSNAGLVNQDVQEISSLAADQVSGAGHMFSSITQEMKDRVNQETYEEMKNIYCKPYLLSSFFHRIFYNVDELFIFKKYFTTHHAVNSFFSYVFQQTDIFTLQQLAICKTSGCVSFNEAKLIELIKNKFMRRAWQAAQQNNSELDFEQLEEQEFSQQLNLLPFRLTNNIVEFIGRAGGGLSGVFAGTITACSLALTKHHEKLMPLLNLVYRDDLNDKSEPILQLINQCVLYVKFKMLSLSKHESVLNIDNFLDQDSDYAQEAMAKATGQQKPPGFIQFVPSIKVPREYFKYEMEKPHILEEFNKKVFDLIEMSMDDARLGLMPSNWNAWF